MNRAYDKVQKLNDTSFLIIRGKRCGDSRLNRNLEMDVIDKFSFHQIENILFQVNLAPNKWPNDRCFCFHCWASPLVSFRPSKKDERLRRVFCIIFWAWNSPCTTKKAQKIFTFRRKRLSSKHNNFLRTFKLNFLVFGLQIHFWTQQVTLAWNGLFTTANVKDMR